MRERDNTSIQIANHQKLRCKQIFENNMGVAIKRSDGVTRIEGELMTLKSGLRLQIFSNNKYSYIIILNTL
ncbi:unnamed protein product [Paramecium octaurelia]|uniref:Uncharacterized protein n=1 Tax=Paramecium octaurelia TaxID=43137 RepID=A0A8S1XK01_PAROT|nr:unnamed protein product [Paramecium octaurelia]